MFHVVEQACETANSWCFAMKMHIAIEVKVNVASVITALSGFVLTIAIICQGLN